MNIDEREEKALKDQTTSYLNLIETLPSDRVTAKLNNDLIEKLVKSLAIIIGRCLEDEEKRASTELEKSEIKKSRDFILSFLSLYYSEKNIDNLTSFRMNNEKKLRNDVFEKKFDMENALETFNYLNQK